MIAADLDALFARMTPLAGRSPAEFEISPLPGLTNRNYRLRAADADWVLRVPRAETGRFVDRDAERHNQRLAADLGIAPLWTWRDASGLSLTATLPGHSPGAADFDDPALIARVAALLRRLHRSRAAFRGRVDPGAAIAAYAGLLSAERRDAFAGRLRRVLEWQAAAAAAALPPVPSHNDPVLDNLLLDGERAMLIDWEFSAMASPLWDLATVANAADLGPAACRLLLENYCAGDGVVEESALYAFRNLLALLDDCWTAALPGD